MKKQQKIILIGVMALVILGLVGTFGNFTSNPNTGATYHKAKSSEKREPTTADLAVTRASDGKLVSYSGFEGKNALELLKLVGFVETKSFGDMGEFVQAIDGISGDDKHFWSLYINGKQSQVGASQYQTKAGDKVEWKYEEIK